MLTHRELRVEDVMSREVRTVKRNDNLAIADDIMTQAHVRHLVVMDEYGGVAGVISSRDLFKGALAKAFGYGTETQRKTLETLVAKEVMTNDVITIKPSAPAAEAATIMVDRKIGCLPVVEGGQLKGILTESDIVALVARGGVPAR
jgi:CBS domain-containing protein